MKPLTGRRLAAVYPPRTQKEYTPFCQELVATWPEAGKIRLVQDNLNTHHASAFYENLPAHEAFALRQRFEFHDTPRSASGLNRIEIEFSTLARQCLDRRIATLEKLKQEVLSIIQARNAKEIKIHWQFSLARAREKRNSHYQRVFAQNTQYKKT
jgi:recombinational DNA repair ATPase RecF